MSNLQHCSFGKGDQKVYSEFLVKLTIINLPMRTDILTNLPYEILLQFNLFAAENVGTYFLALADC